MCVPRKYRKVETRSRDSNSGSQDCEPDTLPHDHGHHSTLYHAFSSFPTMFSTLSKGEIIILATFNLPSAYAFNLNQSKILLFGKELTLYHTINFKICSNWKHLWARTEMWQKWWNFYGVKTLWKRKATSIFSFAHNVFKRLLPQGCWSSGFYGKGLKAEFNESVQSSITHLEF